MTLLLTYLFLALFLAAMCSILEATLLSSTSSYIESLSKKGYSVKTVDLVRGVKDNINKSISSILTINTFATTMCAAGVGSQATIVFGSDWQAVVAFILTLLMLYIAEIYPKTMAAIYWKKFLVPSSYVITVLIKITYPLIWFASFITNYLQKNKQSENNFSKDEIMAIVNLSEQEGTLKTKESTLIENLFKLAHIRTEEIMTPRSVVFAFNSKITVDEAIKTDKTYIFSRIPVYNETIDDIVGVVYSQTILEEAVEDKDDTLIKDLMKPIRRVSKDMSVSALLELLIAEQTHILIVEDKYGQTSGIVTLEDAIETLLGVEIVDETDECEDMQALARNRVKKNKELLSLKKIIFQKELIK